MEQSIKIGNLDLANLTAEKEEELLETLQKRMEERKTADSDFVIVRARDAGVFFRCSQVHCQRNDHAR